jgi:transposase
MDVGFVSGATTKKLIHMLKKEKYGKISDRIRVALFGLENETASNIANRLRRRIRWVQFWAARFRDFGIPGLFNDPKSGAPNKLSPELQQSFKKRVTECPTPDDGVSRFGGKELQAILKNEFNVEFSLSGVYALLHKINLSWITPRPVHPKNDPKAMKAWREENPEFISEVKKNTRGK